MSEFICIFVALNVAAWLRIYGITDLRIYGDAQRVEGASLDPRRSLAVEKRKYGAKDLRNY